MKAYYNKAIVIEAEDGDKKAVVIFDEKLHIPVTYTLNKNGMDEVLHLLNVNDDLKPNAKR